MLPANHVVVVEGTDAVGNEVGMADDMMCSSHTFALRSLHTRQQTSADSTDQCIRIYSSLQTEGESDAIGGMRAPRKADWREEWRRRANTRGRASSCCTTPSVGDQWHRSGWAPAATILAGCGPRSSGDGSACVMNRRPSLPS